MNMCICTHQVFDCCFSVFPWAVPQTEHTSDTLRAEDGGWCLFSLLGQNCHAFQTSCVYGFGSFIQIENILFMVHCLSLG